MATHPDVIREWARAAPFWEKHRDAIRRIFAPVADALIEDAGIARGSTVADIAIGPGDPAFTIAEFVGPDGSVVGIDPVEPMIEAARRLAAAQAIRNIRFEVAVAERLPFPDDTFDAAVCRFGIMFCPSPIDALQEMLRVLRPAGRMALAVWSLPEANPFLSTIPAIVDRYVPAPRPEPGAPDTFCFAQQGKLYNLMIQAGATDVIERFLPFTIDGIASFDAFWTLRTEISEKLHAKLSTLTPDQLAALQADAVDAHRPYQTASGMRFPAEVLVVSAAKP